jgi:tRNA G18 (ribose-2'-O)-methylase SpoU
MNEKYLIVCHISKLLNVKQLIRVAIAYQCIPVLIGAASFREEIETLLAELGNRSFMQFDRLSDAKAFFVENSIPIIAVEILENAKNVFEYEFPDSFALMPGNEGTGLNERQIAVADSFVYIPQYGHGTASLNVHVATTIILHRNYLASKLPITR